MGDAAPREAKQGGHPASQGSHSPRDEAAQLRGASSSPKGVSESSGAGDPKLWATTQSQVVCHGRSWERHGVPPTLTPNVYVGRVAASDGPHPGLVEPSTCSGQQREKWSRRVVGDEKGPNLTGSSSQGSWRIRGHSPQTMAGRPPVVSVQWPPQGPGLSSAALFLPGQSHELDHQDNGQVWPQRLPLPSSGCP